MDTNYIFIKIISFFFSLSFLKVQYYNYIKTWSKEKIMIINRMEKIPFHFLYKYKIILRNLKILKNII